MYHLYLIFAPTYSPLFIRMQHWRCSSGSVNLSYILLLFYTETMILYTFIAGLIAFRFVSSLYALISMFSLLKRNSSICNTSFFAIKPFFFFFASVELPSRARISYSPFFLFPSLFNTGAYYVFLFSLFLKNRVYLDVCLHLCTVPYQMFMTNFI